VKVFGGKILDFSTKNRFTDRINGLRFTDGPIFIYPPLPEVLKDPRSLLSNGLKGLLYNEPIGA
jgi:hypothetical protein